MFNTIYSVSEVCDLLKISRATLYKFWLKNTGPVWFKIGRRKMVSEAALNEWVKKLQNFDT